MKLSMALVAFISFFASSGSASATNFNADLNVDLKIAALKTENNELVLGFQDHDQVSGVCPLYVERMEYISAVDTLLVNLAPTMPCNQDNYGRREGTLKWVIPSTLVGSSKLKLVVNGKTLSNLVIASGTVTQTQP